MRQLEFNNPNLPFRGSFADGVQKNDAVVIRALPYVDRNRWFAFNVYTTSGEVALHAAVQFPMSSNESTTILMSSKLQGQWSQQVRFYDQGTLTPNTEFSAVIGFGGDRFEMSINNVHIGYFAYNVSMDEFATFEIVGELIVYNVIFRPPIQTMRTNDSSHVKRPLSPEPQAEPVSLGTYPRLPKMEKNGAVTFEERHEGYAAQKINVVQHDSAINSAATWRPPSPPNEKSSASPPPSSFSSMHAQFAASLRNNMSTMNYSPTTMEPPPSYEDSYRSTTISQSPILESPYDYITIPVQTLPPNPPTLYPVNPGYPVLGPLSPPPSQKSELCPTPETIPFPPKLELINKTGDNGSKCRKLPPQPSSGIPRRITINGRPTNDAKQFAIELMAEEEIALSFRAVFSHKKKKKADDEVNDNGRYFTEYHLLNPIRITHMQIFGNIYVDNIIFE